MSTTRARTLDLKRLRDAVAGIDAAVRVRLRLQPAGGDGDKVFPPTYAGAVYAWEDRLINGGLVRTVLLDSVQSQANRLEEALLEAYRSGAIGLPVVEVDFSQDMPEDGRRYTSLDVPHRIFDAIIRDSLMDGQPFPDTDLGRRVAKATTRDATDLFGVCPTALVFGAWNSTGMRSGIGNKFARALASEVVAVRAVHGVRTGGRLDPLGITRVDLYKSNEGDWTAEPAKAERDAKGNPVPFRRKKEDKGKPSEINHGNVTPDIARDGKTKEALSGGVTMEYALQTTVLSLAALRKLHFPDGSGSTAPGRDTAARTVLAALGLAAIAFRREQGYHLRSRCELTPEEEPVFALVKSAKDVETFVLSTDEAATLLQAAVAEATKKYKLPWRVEPVLLRPKPALVALVRKSREVSPDAEEAP
jgi:CRISPR-associated protein Csb1